jgi:uncharacterized protein YhfF
MTTQEFFQEFLQKTGKDPQTTFRDSYYFGHTQEMADELLELVLSGKKRATAGCFLAYLPEELPNVGDYYILIDWDKNPRCVIEVTQVTIIPFNEMTFDICSREGEDECLETWKEGHRRFFTLDAAAVGYEFTEDALVVFEDFAVVYQA